MKLMTQRQTEEQLGALDDGTIVERVREGETESFQLLMRRYNQRLFRAVRSVVRDDDEAEEVVQESWCRVYERLGQWRGEASFATWLTRIGLHEALARSRRRRRRVVGDGAERLLEFPSPNREGSPDPERGAARSQLREVLQRAVDDLPEGLRTVFVLRDVEGVSTPDCAAVLALSTGAIRVRLHRARALLRAAIEADLERASAELFAFYRPRCDRSVRRVLERIVGSPVPPIPAPGEYP